MRKIIAYKNYFSDFIKKLSKDETNKIRRSLDLFKVEDKIPGHFINSYVMEFMSFVSLMVTMSFVSFFIYDGDAVVVLFNAFRKKTQKTPDSEIKKAIKLKEEYYGTKGNQ
jgi:phage-related protein